MTAFPFCGLAMINMTPTHSCWQSFSLGARRWRTFDAYSFSLWHIQDVSLSQHVKGTFERRQRKWTSTLERLGWFFQTSVYFHRKSGGWLSTTGARPLIQLRSRLSGLHSFFFCPELQQPGILTAWSHLILKLLSGCSQSFWDEEWQQAVNWVDCVTVWLKCLEWQKCKLQCFPILKMEIWPCREWGSTNIDFYKNWVSHSGEESVSVLRAWRISHWKRLMTSEMHSGAHLSLQPNPHLVWE